MNTEYLTPTYHANSLSLHHRLDEVSPAIAVDRVSKMFGSASAVKSVSFEARRGEILGIVGPNGAGKTTLIRMIMDIFRPDSGTIQIFGRSMGAIDKGKIGYLPEERGIYTEQKVYIVLEYLAKLKGLTAFQARENAAYWLERAELFQFKDRLVQELSKGNQQKIQLIAALIANPDILILDEPLAGLDPVNARMLTSLIRELAAEGKTILFSSHQMNIVESLCSHILIIHSGETVTYGKLDEVRQLYSDNTIFVQSNADFTECPLAESFYPYQNGQKVLLQKGIVAEELLSWLIRNGSKVVSFEQSATRLEDIYIQIAKKRT